MAGFAEDPASEEFEDQHDLHQRNPEALHLVGLVRAVVVFDESERVGSRAQRTATHTRRDRIAAAVGEIARK